MDSQPTVFRGFFIHLKKSFKPQNHEEIYYLHITELASVDTGPRTRKHFYSRPQTIILYALRSERQSVSLPFWETIQTGRFLMFAFLLVTEPLRLLNFRCREELVLIFH